MLNETRSFGISIKHYSCEEDWLLAAAPLLPAKEWMTGGKKHQRSIKEVSKKQFIESKPLKSILAV